MRNKASNPTNAKKSAEADSYNTERDITHTPEHRYVFSEI